MSDTPLIAMTLATCGAMTLLILARALRDVLMRLEEDEKEEAEG